MLFSYIKQALETLNKESANLTSDEVYRRLRALCLDDFGLVLLGNPYSQYPNLSKHLPAMASEAVQKRWTGGHGVPLLTKSLAFTRILNARCYEELGTGLKGKRILDYGCGYGRILRLMHYYNNPSELAGCDPGAEALGICKEAGLKCDLKQSEFLPDRLPFDDASFDVIYAFSVFTHTSEDATRTALAALRKAIRPGGFLMVTTRPYEYWNTGSNLTPQQREQYKQKHRENGFAFHTYGNAKLNAETYGDTSMTLNKLKELGPGWARAGLDRNLDDPTQLLVTLKPV